MFKLITPSEGRIMKKFALGLVIAAVAVFGSGVAAQASTYPPSGTVEAPPQVVPGGSIEAKITGCAPPEVITFVLQDDEKTAICVEAAAKKSGFAALTVATGTGTASVTFTAPSTPGTYVITATGSAGFQGSTTTTVAAASATPAIPAGGLPATGTDGISTITMMAIGFFAVGGGLLVVSQMRRRQIVAA
jgi:hypothetical protein